MARNSYFRFKQFTVQQDRCAMKVCTDACVFGAWAEVSGAGRILDIGTGTGLLSLMAAQRNHEVQVDAVEIDSEAAAQARENVQGTPFAERIQVHQSPIQDFDPVYRFDTILVNPPFFQSDLRSPDARINQAHHAESLTFSELLTAVARLLEVGGTWHVLLPPDESSTLTDMALAQDWVKQRELTLYHTYERRPFRIMTTFAGGTFTQEKSVSERLAIFDADGQTHTLAFRELLQEIYLNF
ncbi:tRNA1(Val) (adenine(37)-N6)-methyltransferase [Salmonirosea aquatica]|uniref:tRNA1(Val) (adenine(37)-N6)-methyltransferase n=1 Tax=Salmonirosea aquatica TaxID=2654236 RepID=A0A7C9BDY0_9BACT|nr:methyltransferase [Cytophagaceae bacterium SJW1-29]